MDAATIYGCSPMLPPGADVSGLAHGSTVDFTPGYRGLANPRNPLMWLGVLLLATVGAAGLAGSVRLGPAKLSGAIGKS